MSRSLFKGPTFGLPFNLKENKNKIKIFNKSSVILPEYLNKVVFIYNGKKFIKLIIQENMIGYKFGEFIHTRARYKYKK